MAVESVDTLYFLDNMAAKLELCCEGLCGYDGL